MNKIEEIKFNHEVDHIGMALGVTESEVHGLICKAVKRALKEGLDRASYLIDFIWNDEESGLQLRVATIFLLGSLYGEYNALWGRDTEIEYKVVKDSSNGEGIDITDSEEGKRVLKEILKSIIRKEQS